VGWFSGAGGPDPKTKRPSGLWNAYEAVGEIMDIDVVMWGNAQGDPTTGEVKCQHGSVECWLHSVYACSKNLNPTVDAYLPLIHCFDETLITTFPGGLPAGTVNQSYAESTMTSCAKEVSLDFAAITKCIGSDDGLKFLAAEMTKTPSHTGVPFTVINDISSADSQTGPPLDVITMVCNAYNGTKPKNCTTLAKSPYAYY